jgi:Uma2 family endonuclease
MTRTARRIGPADHGRRMSLDEFISADFEEGLFELARGVVEVREVPGLSHGRIVDRVARMFILYDIEHRGLIEYQASAAACCIRLPEMQASRSPDQAVYLLPPPPGDDPWTRWIPEIVVEILNEESEHRDTVEKREEYLRAGVREYWIIDPKSRTMLVLRRAGDAWDGVLVPPGATYRTHLLPGLEVRPDDLLGPA